MRRQPLPREASTLLRVAALPQIPQLPLSFFTCSSGNPLRFLQGPGSLWVSLLISHK